MWIVPNRDRQPPPPGQPPQTRGPVGSDAYRRIRVWAAPSHTKRGGPEAAWRAKPGTQPPLPRGHTTLLPETEPQVRRLRTYPCEASPPRRTTTKSSLADPEIREGRPCKITSQKRSIDRQVKILHTPRRPPAAWAAPQPCAHFKSTRHNHTSDHPSVGKTPPGPYGWRASRDARA